MPHTKGRQVSQEGRGTVNWPVFVVVIGLVALSGCTNSTPDPIPTPVPVVCSHTNLDAVPNVTKAREVVTLTLTIENCGDGPLEGGFTYANWDWKPRTKFHNRSYWMEQGSASDAFAGYLWMVDSWTIPAHTVNQTTWTWNGTFVSCAERNCTHDVAPPANYAISSEISRGWFVNTSVRIVE